MHTYPRAPVPHLGIMSSPPPGSYCTFLSLSYSDTAGSQGHQHGLVCPVLSYVWNSFRLALPTCYWKGFRICLQSPSPHLFLFKVQAMNLILSLVKRFSCSNTNWFVSSPHRFEITSLSYTQFLYVVGLFLAIQFYSVVFLSLQALGPSALIMEA